MAAAKPCRSARVTPAQNGGFLRDRVLAIVNIIAQYVYEKRDLSDDGNIIQELLDTGFNLEEINAAFHWIEDLSTDNANNGLKKAETCEGSTRVFTAEEKRSLTLEAQGLLMKMRDMGILTCDEMEEIIGQVVSVEEDGLSFQELKAVIALTLFSRSLEQYGREMEYILKDEWSLLYH
jgi:Smg protein